MEYAFQFRVDKETKTLAEKAIKRHGRKLSHACRELLESLAAEQAAFEVTKVIDVDEPVVEYPTLSNEKILSQLDAARESCRRGEEKIYEETDLLTLIKQRKAEKQSK